MRWLKDLSCRVFGHAAERRWDALGPVQCFTCGRPLAWNDKRDEWEVQVTPPAIHVSTPDDY